MPLISIDTSVKALAALLSVVLSVVLGYYFQMKLKQREERSQQERENEAKKLRFYLPLLRFCYDLDRRLGHILTVLHLDWLKASYLTEIKAKQGFASNPQRPGYFILSTVYLLACFFGWSEAIKRSADPGKIPRQRPLWRRRLSILKQALLRRLGLVRAFRFDPNISTISKVFQYEELFSQFVREKALKNPLDACKLHKQLQYSIGELMLHAEPSGAFRCKNFREFFEDYRENGQLCFWLTMLEGLVTDMTHFPPEKTIEEQVVQKNDMRPLRLLAIRYWCRVLMRTIGEELDVETPIPSDVFKGVSASIRSCIEGVQVEQLESYLLEVGATKGL